MISNNSVVQNQIGSIFKVIDIFES